MFPNRFWIVFKTSSSGVVFTTCSLRTFLPDESAFCHSEGFPENRPRLFDSEFRLRVRLCGFPKKHDAFRGVSPETSATHGLRHFQTMRALILTAGFGEGHNAAARALEGAFIARFGAGSARTHDLFAEAAPRLNAVARVAYLKLINHCPSLWSGFYGLAAWRPVADFLPRLLHREQALLAGLLDGFQPDFICSTYPVYAFLMRNVRPASLLPPHFNVVTDSISIHPLWWNAGSTAWFLPNEDSADVMRKAGIADEEIEVCGFPVSSAIAENAHRLSPLDLASGAAPRVLYLANSGTAAVRRTAELLLSESEWEVTCAVGRNKELQQSLEAIALKRTRPARILGWTNEIPQLLLTHHAVVSKAGGATTQEAIASRCPMIVNQIIPGQEEGNYELLRRCGGGRFAGNPGAIIAALHQVFEDGGREWRLMREGLGRISRPTAADAIVERIRQRLTNS